MAIFKTISRIIKKIIKAEEASKFQKNEITKNDEISLYNSFNWCCGGFIGKYAERVDNAEITGLSIHENNLLYNWQKGGCESFGAKSPTDYRKAYACLFCKVDGEWIGGKFDWISTSRTSRDFKNIKENYKKWDYNYIRKAKEFAFVIVSIDGKKRTNVIRSDI